MTYKPQFRPTRHQITLESMAEGARFENPEATGTIGPDLTLSFRSQSFTGDLDVAEEPIKRDRTQ
jgi:hypothetical protein